MSTRAFNLFETFARIFRANILARSRTAGGVSDTASSAQKKPLLKSGEELRRQVERNTADLIRVVWEARNVRRITPNVLRRLLESWYDIINRELQDPDAYREEYERLEIEAARLRMETARPYRINRRYRVWDFPYSTIQLTPVELEIAMDQFYRALAVKIRRARSGDLSQAELLAYADAMLDRELHPWADGCGRNATAAVMWLSLLVPGWHLPIFGTGDDHYDYSHISDLESHIRYYERCLNRRA